MDGEQIQYADPVVLQTAPVAPGTACDNLDQAVRFGRRFPSDGQLSEDTIVFYIGWVWVPGLLLDSVWVHVSQPLFCLYT